MNPINLNQLQSYSSSDTERVSVLESDFKTIKERFNGFESDMIEVKTDLIEVKTSMKYFERFQYGISGTVFLNALYAEAKRREMEKKMEAMEKKRTSDMEAMEKKRIIEMEAIEKKRIIEMEAMRKDVDNKFLITTSISTVALASSVLMPVFAEFVKQIK